MTRSIQKNVRFYTTFFPPEGAHDFTYIWVPDSRDAGYYIEYYRRYGGRPFEIEDRLRRHLPDEPTDVSTFHVSPAPSSGKGRARRPVILYAQSDTLADSAARIYSALSDEVPLRLFYPAYKDEGAEAFFAARGLPAEKFSIKRLWKAKPRLLVLFNDWAKEAQRVISICRLMRIPTVCIQESIIDFGDRFRRMQHADHVCMQGIQSVLDLPREAYYITGNPRYQIRQPSDESERRQRPLKALVNCNFTYGIYEEVRDVWLADVTSALTEHHIDFRISQHPRDRGDLRRYGDRVISSGAATIAQQIAESDLIITRFSSLIHEGILQGKKVIYYNPHGENMKYEFRFNDTFLFLCTTSEALKKAIARIKQALSPYDHVPYCIEHCLPYHTSVMENLKRIFTQAHLPPRPVTFKDFLRLFLYQPWLLKTLRKGRRMLRQLI